MLYNTSIIDKTQEIVNKQFCKYPNRGRQGGGGGHAGIVIKKGKYVTVLKGEVEFTIPSHTEHYPAADLDDPNVQSKEEE